MFKRSSFAVAALLCVAVGCGEEKTEDLGGMRSQSLSKQDNNYIRDIAQGNMTEIQSSQVALQSSNNPAVKAFAQHMVTDHNTDATTMMSVVSAKGAKAPTMLDTDHKDMVQSLNGKSGADFDKAYVDLQVKAHEATINVDQDEADNGNDPDLKSAAAGLLPQLKEHLMAAQKLQANMSGM